MQKGTAQSRSKHYAEKCGKNSPPIQSRLKKMIKKHRRSYDDDISAVIRAYTSNDFYGDLNKALYEDTGDSLHNYGGYVHALRLSMKSLCNSQNVREGIVHRSISLTPEQLAQYKPGFKFLWPNFVSTSRKNYKRVFGDVSISIDLAGEGLTYALDISKLSLYPEEEEVLIYPYSGFEVLTVNKTADGSTSIHMRTVDTLHIEPDFGGCPCGSMPSLTEGSASSWSDESDSS